MMQPQQIFPVKNKFQPQLEKYQNFKQSIKLFHDQMPLKHPQMLHFQKEVFQQKYGSQNHLVGGLTLLKNIYLYKIVDLGRHQSHHLQSENNLLLKNIIMIYSFSNLQLQLHHLQLQKSYEDLQRSKLLHKNASSNSIMLFIWLNLCI